MKFSFGQIARRLFSTIHIRPSQKFLENVEKNSGKIKADDKANTTYGEKFTGIDVEEISRAITEDPESQEMLNPIKEFRKTANKTLVIDGAPKDLPGIKLTSYLVAKFIHKVLEPLENVFFLQKKTDINGLKPHSDGSNSGNRILLTSVGGVTSDGEISTGYASSEEIFSKLPKKSQEILCENIFKYYGEKPDERDLIVSNPIPLFYKESDGSLGNNLFTSNHDGLAFDSSRSRFQSDEIEAALDQVYQVSQKIMAESTKDFNIQEGQIVFMKNKSGVHWVKNPNLGKTPNVASGSEENITKESHRGVVLQSYAPIPTAISPKSNQLAAPELTTNQTFKK